MARRLLFAICVALTLLASTPGAVYAQDTSAAPMAQLPLKREPSAQDASLLSPWGWSALLLLGVAGALSVAWKRRRPPDQRGAQDAPRPMSRASLTPQASLHVVEWRGERLLLACTPHAVSVLARHELP